MVGRAFASAATLLIPVTLVRVFDQTEYGTYKQLFLVFATLYSVALVGLSDSLYYFVPRDPPKGGRYVANAIAGLVLAGGACLAGLYATRHVVAEWMKNPILSDHLGSIGLFYLHPHRHCPGSRSSRKRHVGHRLSSDVARAAFFVLLILLAGLHMLSAIAFGAPAAGRAAVVKREFGAESARRASRVRPAAYAMPFALYVLVEILQSTFHQYAVSWSFDAATFAIYSVGCFQVPFVDFLATPASSVMMVRMTEEMPSFPLLKRRCTWFVISTQA
jgi:O-antigen/teichoic acid export membrane protein